MILCSREMVQAVIKKRPGKTAQKAGSAKHQYGYWPKGTKPRLQLINIPGPDIVSNPSTPASNQRSDARHQRRFVNSQGPLNFLGSPKGGEKAPKKPKGKKKVLALRKSAASAKGCKWGWPGSAW